MLIVLLSSSSFAEGFTVDHTSVAAFDSIPAEYIDSVRNSPEIYHGHASHGMQLHTGLDMLQAENSIYTPPAFNEVSVYVDQDGVSDTSWVPDIRSYLNANPACDLVIMTWCQGVARGTEETINTYFSKMSNLEAAYPTVDFVYQTGHLSYWSPVNTTERNDQIRQYCIDNDKILYDFADIESYDPDGNYYPDDSDTCLWCIDWCATNTCPPCYECAHSHCFNCYNKGKALWYLIAKLRGWGRPGIIGPPRLVLWGDEE